MLYHQNHAKSKVCITLYYAFYYQNISSRNPGQARYRSSRPSGNVVPCQADLEPPIGATKNWNDRCGGPLTVRQLQGPCRSKEHHHRSVTKRGSQLELYLAKRSWLTSKSEDCQILLEKTRKIAQICPNIEDCNYCMCIACVAHCCTSHQQQKIF